MKTAAILLTTLILTQLPFPQIIQAAPNIAQTQDEGLLTPQEVQKTAKEISVRITAENNGGSGVIIAQKGNTYLILTNAHVVKRATKLEIQAPDGQKYPATLIDGGFDSKYDLALLQFTSTTKYTLANLSSIAGSPIEPGREIYSAGFPFDSNDIRITTGAVSQLSDIPFNDGTQLGYVTNKGEKGIRQGMSGGAIFDAQGNLLGINTIGIAPILPDYTYNDGSKPIAKLKAQYTRANWGIPIYNFLTNVKADILYGYDNLPKVERQVTPTGYMAKLNIKARQMTVRIENSGGNGSGGIVARQGSTYYVLTAKHVMKSPETNKEFTNHQIITYDQDRYSLTGNVVAEGVDLAIVKFSSSNTYPVAKLGEYSPNQNDLVFVGGYPGREKINSPLWQWQLNPGFINDPEQGKLQIQNNASFSNGYDLIYSSISYGGMSGGPVFDTDGNVIGIHGRGESADLNSLGISIQTFIGLATKLQVTPNLLNIVSTNPVDLNSTNLENVMAAMQNIPQPQLVDNGKRWLAYGNQLYRTRQLDSAIVAFDRAIAKNEILSGNYGKAVSLLYSGKYQLAENAIAQAIAAVLRSERKQYYYLWSYESLILKIGEKYEQALKSIDIAIGLELNDLKLLNEKALILIEQKQYPAAISIYNEIIRKQPESYAYYNRGNAKSDLGDNQAAITDYDRAIAINPKHANAYINRGNAKSDLGDNQAAIADYDRAIALNPQDAQAYVNRGVAKYFLGDNQAAIADYDRAIAINPKYANAYSNRGTAKYFLGDNQVAITDYDRAIAINPKHANAYIGRGNAKSDLGDNQAAITDYDRAIALNPKSADAYMNRGTAKSALGKKQAAIADYDRAIALNPQLALAYMNRGNAKSDLGDNQAAIVDYDRAIALNPQDAQAYYNRGVAKSALGNNQAAIADYDRAIALNPQDAQAYYNRGVAKSALGNNQAAIADYDRAIAINPQFAEAYVNRGLAKSALGDKKGAIIDYDRAIAVNPQFSDAYYLRGVAKSALGNNQAAIADYDRAIAINSQYADAYYNRGFIKANYIGDKQGGIADISKAAELYRQQEKMDDYKEAIEQIEKMKRS